MTYLGDDQATISQLGVLPYFESIRRKAQEQEISVSLAVLSGSVVILPTDVVAELKELLPQVPLSFSSIGHLDQKDYVQIGFPSSAKGIVAAVTELFQRGRIQVLVGTKSLHGEGWDALVVADQFEIVTEVATQKQKIPVMLLLDALKWVRMSLLLLAVDLFVLLFRLRLIGVWWLTAACLLFLVFASWRYLRYKSPYKRLQSLGEQIRKALLDSGHLTDDQSRVQVEEDKENYMVFAYLKGGNMRDKELFAQTMGEFFAPVDNQRYPLKAEKVRQGQSPYYVVPSLFDKRKEEAQKFLDFLRPTIGRYHLVYTRTETGRKILLEARIKALSNQNDRTLTKKKVKSRLE